MSIMHKQMNLLIDKNQSTMTTHQIKLIAKTQNQDDYHVQNIEGKIINLNGEWKVEVPIVELPGDFVVYNILNASTFIPTQDLLVIGDVYQESKFKVKVLLLEEVTTKYHEYSFGNG